VRRNPDGGQPIAVTEGDIKSRKGNNKDFISRGATDCEFSFCVRDAQFDAGSVDAGQAALGYCSRECFEGQECPSFDESLDKSTSGNRLKCRALLLDKAVLDALYGSDGGLGVREPYFCSRGDSPDASM
jgi:hypothetical protein